MALVRVCDRCECDDDTVMVVVTFEVNKEGKEVNPEYNSAGTRVTHDLCLECRVKLAAFMSGEYGDDDFPDTCPGCGESPHAAYPKGTVNCLWNYGRERKESDG
jgi:hypothetical protein